MQFDAFIILRNGVNVLHLPAQNNIPIPFFCRHVTPLG
jgi:hypothetical protein